MVSVVYSATVVGVKACTVELEIHIDRGLSVFSIVGLPASSVSESRTRVKSALSNLGYGFPRGRVTVNMAPANIRKDGTSYDLAVALGLLLAQGLIPPHSLARTLLIGEVSLDGRVRSVPGVLPILASAAALGFCRVIAPTANVSQLPRWAGPPIHGVDDLTQVVECLHGRANFNQTPCRQVNDEMDRGSDLADIRGQPAACRAAVVAVTGGHNLLLSGPPGAGKTMLAKRLTTILPKMSDSEALEAACIASVAGENCDRAWMRRRPFRSPHHTISDAALIGGGARVTPGEVSLAHHGVLFLDELPEFRRSALESLRQPLEDGEVTIARVLESVKFPANFMLVASLNPCPCGYFGHPKIHCECSSQMLHRYRNKLSGPLLDRFDIHVDMKPLSLRALESADTSYETSDSVRLRVGRARQLQAERLSNTKSATNGDITAGDLPHLCRLDTKSRCLLQRASESLSLSARAYQKIIRVARTIADLDESGEITTTHLAEAIQYRPRRTLDR